MLISSLEFALAVCGLILEVNFYFFADLGKDVLGRSSFNEDIP